MQRPELQLFARDAHNPSMTQLRAHRSFDGEIVDFCVPVNQYFPPPALRDEIVAHLDDILKHYPDEAADQARNLARFIDVPADNLVVSNGSTEIITELCREVFGPFVTTVPTFGRWTDLPRELGLPTHFIPREEARDFRVTVQDVIDTVRRQDARAVVICNPDNPTGTVWSTSEVLYLMSELDDLDLVAIDESFIDFAGVGSVAAAAVHTRATVVVKSMGKSLGWHGIRLGHAVTNAERARTLRQAMPYWNINGLAAFVLRQLPAYRAEFDASFVQMAADRATMTQMLAQVPGLRVWPSACNFVFCRLPDGMGGKVLRDRLLTKHGLFVRECSNKLGSTEQFFRLAVMKPDVVARLVAAMTEEMDILRRERG